MGLIKAQEDDQQAVLNFYDCLIEHTEHMDIYARWKKGMHPTEDMVKTYIKSGALYIDPREKGIAGAVAITMEQGEDYHHISWKIDAEDDEVAVIHILGVGAEYQRMGIGKELIDEAIALAKEKGKKAVRLDALASNIPAQHLYEGKGFKYRGKQHLFAKNTGWTDFYYYELGI